jgi:hypothetical protein
MPLRLRDDIHWCECVGRAVFLDAAADRYFCLPSTANDAFLRLAAGDLRSGDHERLERLVARGMLIETADSRPIRPPPLVDPPTHDFLFEPIPRAAPIQILRTLAWELRAAWLLKTRPFGEVLRAVSALGPTRRSGPTNADVSLRRIVAASIAASLINRAHDRCLVRALAVHAACRRAGIKPRLLFGVTANPFSAHSWVQLGGAVLVGGFEQARLYTPILVVE